MSRARRDDAGSTPVRQGTTTFPAIVAVGIKNIGDVESHVIHTVAGSRSHIVRFINSGLLQFAYNQEGEIINLRSENLQAQLINGNEIMYSIA